VLAIGGSLERVEANIAAVRAAAADAGRDPSALRIWAYSFFSIAASREAAVTAVKAFLASVGAFRGRARHVFDRCPEDVKPLLRYLQEHYDPSEHVWVGGRNERLVDDPRLAEFLTRESAVVGTSDEVALTITGLEDLGVDTLICALPGNADKLGTLRKFAAAAGRPPPTSA
jgi:alkanesulfonate monooxygenase SsuD/methylene tetrahydromethanopterin reductase-like flavin-dependent oxidoreductase (luciferase family)